MLRIAFLELNMTFNDLGLKPELLQAIEELGYTNPTEIQEKAIPHLIQGEGDFIGQAQTGTGKTAAFLLPLLNKLNADLPYIQALILTPTRELAVQVTQEVEKLGKHLRVRALPVYGGTSYEPQIRGLKKDRPSIVIGTPGRIIDLIERGTLKFERAEHIILDEADEMLNMGFFEDVQNILDKFEKNKKLWMFSATMPKPILDLINKKFNNPRVVKIKKQTLSNEDIDQRFYVVLRKNHFEALCRILDNEDDFFGLIFCRTKLDTRELADELLSRGYKVDTLNGDMGQNERDASLARFKSRKVNILICTDVAARGIDVTNMSHVINYNLPIDIESYIHRIGRTGRAGMKGISIALVDPKELFKIKKIEAFIKKPLKKLKLPTIDNLKSNLIMTELKKFEPVLVRLKHQDFAVESSFDTFNSGFLELSKEEILKVFFSHFFHHKLKKIDELGNLDCENKSVDFSGNSIRLFMNMGKEDGLSLKILLDEISKKINLPRNNIRKVELKNRFSFFEVPARYGEILVKSSPTTIKKRKVNFELSAPRKG